MSDNLLQIKDLTVEYHTTEEIVHAVNHINLEIGKGETLGLVGETGAGKTTTALSILRLLPDRTGKIASGSIIFEGEDLLTISEEKMRRGVRGDRISMIFQDPMTALNPVIPVGDQIEEAIRNHSDKMSKAEIRARAEEVLELVGIPASRKYEYPHQFSGGMKQRVVIAIALSCEPDLLIADEPTTALDVTIQAQVLAMMQDLRDRFNMSMIMITHDLGIVAETCDKVAVMYAGEIIENGTLEDIFTGEIHHPYTVGLFGAIPDLNKETDRLSAIEGLMPDPSVLPEGCPFAERCPKCIAGKCDKQKPSVYESGTHKISCFLFADEKKEEK